MDLFDLVHGTDATSPTPEAEPVRANIDHNLFGLPLTGNVGMQAVYTEQSSNGFSASGTGASTVSLAETTLPSVPSAASGSSLSSDKRVAPKETIALFMLSLGYTVRDLSHSGLSDYVDVDHLEGHMPLEEVSLTAATAAARTWATFGLLADAARHVEAPTDTLRFFAVEIHWSLIDAETSTWPRASPTKPRCSTRPPGKA